MELASGLRLLPDEVEAELTPSLPLSARFSVIDSQAIPKNMHFN